MSIDSLVKKYNYTNIDFQSMRTPFYFLYNLYSKANEYIEKFSFQPHIQKVEVVSQLPNVINETNNFFPEDIKSHIKLYASNIIQFRFSINNERNITIYFIVDDSNKLNIEAFINYAKKMCTWICMIHNIASIECSKNVSIYLFFTPFHKSLPKSPIDNISSEHINTAFTTSCSLNTQIVIFRQEEWFKVFLHETFHNYGLDFSNKYTENMNKELELLFNLNIDFKLYEAYTETWARIMNVFFYSVEKSKNKKSFFSKFIETIKNEIFFSCFQANKFLTFYNMDYSLLFNNNNIYEEDTAAFSYLIITCCLLNNLDSFILWCNENNSCLFKFNKTNTFSFIDLIKDNCKDKNLFKNMKYIKSCNDKKNIKLHSFRMAFTDIF
tara:strand:- start:1404 stop:2549 length:1146 start_codon:yes stop_codon:yes gene_type:complete